MLSRVLVTISLFFITACVNSDSGTIPSIESPTEEVSQNLSFEEFLDAAHLAYQRKDVKNLNKLLEVYKNIFNGENEKNEIRLVEAMFFLSEKNFNKSRDILDSLKKDSNASMKGRALFYLGEIQRRQNQLSKAIPIYLEAHKFFPSDEIYESLADTYSQLGQWDKAIEYYKRVVVKYPDDVNNLYLLGAAYYKAKNLGLSEKTMKKVLELNPRNPYAYQYLAHIAEGRKDSRGYYYNLSRGMLLLKGYSDVIKLLQDQDLVYKDADLSSILISSFVREKQSTKALEVYNKAIKASPVLANTPDFKMYYGILDVIPSKGNSAGKEYFKKLVQTYPDHFLIIFTYAEVLKSLDENDPQLESLYLKLLYLEPQDTMTRYQLAEFYQNQKKTYMAQLEYGILYFYQEQRNESLESLLDLEKKAPQFKNIQLFLYIGLLYQQKGEWSLAKSYYRKALSIDSNNREALVALENLQRKASENF